MKMLCTPSETFLTPHVLKLLLGVKWWHHMWNDGMRWTSVSTEWTILSHVNCFSQGEVVGFQLLLDSLHPCSTRASRMSPPVHQGGSY